MNPIHYPAYSGRWVIHNASNMIWCLGFPHVSPVHSLQCFTPPLSIVVFLDKPLSILTPGRQGPCPAPKDQCTASVSTQHSQLPLVLVMALRQVAPLERPELRYGGTSTSSDHATNGYKRVMLDGNKVWLRYQTWPSQLSAASIEHH